MVVCCYNVSGSSIAPVYIWFCLDQPFYTLCHRLGVRHFRQLTHMQKRNTLNECEHYAASRTFLPIPISEIYAIKVVKIILERPVYCWWWSIVNMYVYTLICMHICIIKTGEINLTVIEHIDCPTARIRAPSIFPKAPYQTNMCTLNDSQRRHITRIRVPSIFSLKSIYYYKTVLLIISIYEKKTCGNRCNISKIWYFWIRNA